MVKINCKGCSFLSIFECKGNARYYTTVGYMNYCIKYCMAAHTNHFKLIQFPVCTHVGVLYSSGNTATGLRKTHTNSIFYLASVVLDDYTVRNVKSCFSAIWLRHGYGSDLTRSVYFLILDVYLSYLDQVLLPITLANIRIKLREQVKNIHCEFYEQYSCQKCMLSIQNLWVHEECKICLSHAGEHKTYF